MTEAHGVARQQDEDGQTVAATRTCPQCHQDKPLSAFNIYEGFRRARICGQCRYRREKVAATPEQRDVMLAQHRTRSQRYGARNGLVLRAHVLVREALIKGTLVKPLQCDDCERPDTPCADGRSNLHAHHEDYSKPLIVQWLCAPCHMARHQRS